MNNTVDAEGGVNLAEAPAEVSLEAAQKPIRLSFLDGLRGLAAVYVVWHHCWAFVAVQAGGYHYPAWFRLMSFLKQGSFGVSIFIVLSGYCLMLPVARTADLQLGGGLLGFVQRRSRRILPPYFACLMLSIVLILLVPGLSVRSGGHWDSAIPALTPQSLVSHALLVHNLFLDLHWKLNAPLWSVALEWQIYFVFALLLLPIARKAGVAVAACIAVILGLIPGYFGGGYIDAWMLGQFGLGMLAASLNFSENMAPNRERLSRLPLGVVAFLLAAAATVVLQKGKVSEMQANLAIGVATAMFLFSAAQAINNRKRPPILALISDQPFARHVGEFSYSLYLIHYPLLAIFFMYLLRLHLTPMANLGVLTVIYVPLQIVVAYAFYRLFERPFMKSRAKV